LNSEDVVLDIGCGDGSALLQFAIQNPKARFIAIDIEASRIEQARANWRDAVGRGDLSADTRVNWQSANALQCFDVWKDATVVFVYLIPRGLKQILPLLEQIQHPLRVISYMAPLPGVTVTHKETITVPHQPDARWPIYFHYLTPSTTSGK
jgi:tRNA A58 N-methylase Trm61